MIRRSAVVAYGAVAYLAFLGSLAYTVGFLADRGVPKGIDDGAEGSVVRAVVVDLALLSLFAVQHSVMARPWFKRALTKVVPPAAERSTFVLAASSVVALLLWQWQPLSAEVWSADASWARGLLWALYLTGWAIVVASTFMIGHFDLFGLRQVLARWHERQYAEPGFRVPGLYALIRHPIMVGFMIAFWSAPDMSVGRLLFAAVASAYIVVAVRFEEHDLRAEFGATYDAYADEVPRFVPRSRRGLAAAPAPQSD